MSEGGETESVKVAESVVETVGMRTLIGIFDGGDVITLENLKKTCNLSEQEVVDNGVQNLDTSCAVYFDVATIRKNPVIFENIEKANGTILIDEEKVRTSIHKTDLQEIIDEITTKTAECVVYISKFTNLEKANTEQKEKFVASMRENQLFKAKNKDLLFDITVLEDKLEETERVKQSQQEKIDELTESLKKSEEKYATLDTQAMLSDERNHTLSSQNVNLQKIINELTLENQRLKASRDDSVAAIKASNDAHNSAMNVVLNTNTDLQEQIQQLKQQIAGNYPTNNNSTVSTPAKYTPLKTNNTPVKTPNKL